MHTNYKRFPNIQVDTRFEISVTPGFKDWKKYCVRLLLHALAGYSL
jgi:hypothetical protein